MIPPKVCPGCRGLLDPWATASGVVCSRCGHIIYLRKEYNPDSGVGRDE